VQAPDAHVNGRGLHATPVNAYVASAPDQLLPMNDALQSTPATMRPAWPWRAASALATLAAGALLAFVLAHWLWRWFGPAPVDVPPAVPRDPAAAIAASGLFAAPGAPVAPAGATEPPLAGDTRLLGVFAERDGKGFALFRLPDRNARLVGAGSEIVSGATLVAVRPDGITVRDAGGERAIALRASPSSAAPKAAPTAPDVKKLAACLPPAGFRGSVIKLNAELAQGLIAQPEALRAIVVPADGGLAVRDDSGFAAMLGLKRGDRVQQANGIALTTPDDVSSAVLKPLVASQAVRLTGTRDGQPRELLLLNAGACT